MTKADHCAQTIRDLADVLCAIEPDDVRLDQLLADLTNAQDALHASVRLISAEEPRKRRFASDSPFSGTTNVNAAPMALSVPDDSTDALPVIEGRVTFGPRYEGPPGTVHGGVLSGYLDELLGVAVSQVAPSVTGTLKLRYKQATPLHVPLLFRAAVTEDRGRIVMAHGTCHVDGAVTVEATAMFVSVGRTR